MTTIDSSNKTLGIFIGITFFGPSCSCLIHGTPMKTGQLQHGLMNLIDSAGILFSFSKSAVYN